MGFFRVALRDGRRHNGGLTQTGVSFLGQSGSGDFPFIDAMKMNQGWTYANAGSIHPRPDELDSNGWPISGVGSWESQGGVQGICYMPTQVQRSGNYVCRWTGNGTIIAPGTLVSGNKTGSAGSGEYVFSPNGVPFTLGIASGSVTDLTCVHEDDVTAFDNGSIFHPDFLDKITNSNFGVVRFLDWLDGNRGLMTDWASRKPVTYYSYVAQETRESIYVGTTTGSGDDFEVASASIPAAYQYTDTGTYVDKQYALVWFDRSASSTTCTFKLGSGPVKPMVRHTTDVLSTNSRPVSGRPALLIYDAALDVWIKNGGDVNDGYYKLHNSVPPEICVALCREIGAHPWFCLPFLAADPLTDWVTELATYIRDTQPNWMIPRFEGPNELWHFSNTTGFPGTQYASARNNVRNNVSAGTKAATSVTFSGVGASGSTTIEFASDHPWSVGDAVFVTGFTGTNVTGFNNATSYVSSVPNSTTVVVTRSSTSSPATWSSGGTVQGLNSDNHGWYGRAMARLGQEVSAIYSDDRTRYEIVCGVQTAGTTASHDERMKSTSYFLETGERAYDWITNICVANYWSNSTAMGTNPDATYLTFSEIQSTYDYFITYAGDSAQQAATLVAYLGDGALPELDTKYTAFYSWANGFGPTMGMMGYEGGYSPDYLFSATTSPITGASVDDGTHVTLTLATTSIQGQTAIAGNGAIVGAYLRITSVGGMTQLNNNTYQISGVAGNSITIVVPDTTGFGAYTSGGSAEYYLTSTVTMTSALNTFRYWSKMHPSIETLTATNLSNFAAAGGVFPANLILAGTTFFNGGFVTTNSAIFALYDPDIYATPTPALTAIQDFTG
jgi:hypothetical protein